MLGLATANGCGVAVDNRPLCVTTFSRGLDPQIGGYNRYDNREAAAKRIALCWNACRHLSDEQLAQQEQSA